MARPPAPGAGCQPRSAGDHRTTRTSTVAKTGGRANARRHSEPRLGDAGGSTHPRVPTGIARAQAAAGMRSQIGTRRNRAVA
jgi:hypothetical protein